MSERVRGNGNTGNGKGRCRRGSSPPAKCQTGIHVGELELYRRLYDLTIWVLNKTDGFPRSKRMSLGLRLEECLLDCLSIAHSFSFRAARPRQLEALSARFDEAKLMIKIAHDLRLISHDAFGFAIERAGVVGQILGAFKKTVVKRACEGAEQTRSSGGLVEQQR